MASINRTSFGLNFKAAEKANMWEAVWEAHMSTDGDHGERSFRCAGECAKSPKTTGSKFKSDSCHAPTAYCFIIPIKNTLNLPGKTKIWHGPCPADGGEACWTTDRSERRCQKSGRQEVRKDEEQQKGKRRKAYKEGENKGEKAESSEGGEGKGRPRKKRGENRQWAWHRGALAPWPSSKLWSVWAE